MAQEPSLALPLAPWQQQRAAPAAMSAPVVGLPFSGQEVQDRPGVTPFPGPLPLSLGKSSALPPARPRCRCGSCRPGTSAFLVATLDSTL